MNRLGGLKMRRIGLSLGLAGGCLILWLLALPTAAAPLGRHCGDVGPLPPEDPLFCGCTWGEVLFHGQPVPGAVITLTFGSGIVTDVTRLTPLELEPYFDLTAYDLGARRGDLLTLTASFAGQTVTRAFRAWPEADGEQHLVLVFPEHGVWSPWVTGGYTRALALAGDVVWAGGPAGVISMGLSTGLSVVQTLPWGNPVVRALAVGADGHIWAVGASGVAEFNGAVWQTHTVPLSGSARAVTVAPTSGVVWVGGGDTTGSVACYTGTWQAAGTFNAPVTALAVDESGYVWAGTWGAGIYRREGSGTWSSQLGTGAFDWVLAATAGEGVVWFGGWPYLSGQGPRGGIARYALATGTWHIYTTAHGLPADVGFPQAPAPVYALAVDGEGVPWAGTADGVYSLTDAGWWAAYTATHGLRPGAVMAVVADGVTTVAATPTGLDRFNPMVTPGTPPTAQMTAVSPLTLTRGTTLTLGGSGQDGDEGGGRILAWEWVSSRDGPLCTTASCQLPHSLLTPGIHTITLRVQDDEGVWSAPALATVTVKAVWRVYLPLVLREY